MPTCKGLCPPGHRTRQQAATRTKEEFNAVAGKLKAGRRRGFEVMDPRHPDEGINLVGGHALAAYGKAREADFRLVRPFAYLVAFQELNRFFSLAAVLRMTKLLRKAQSKVFS